MNSSLAGIIVYAGKCVPSNTTLSAPLAKPFEGLIGAVYGLQPWIITAVAVILAILAILAIRSDKMSVWLKALAWVLLVPIVLWFGLMVYFIVTGSLVDVAACPFS